MLNIVTSSNVTEEKFVLRVTVLCKSENTLYNCGMSMAKFS